MAIPSLRSLQLLEHWWPLLTPCQLLPGHLTRRVQEADLSSAQRRAVRALIMGSIPALVLGRLVSGDSCPESRALTMGSVPAPGCWG